MGHVISMNPMTAARRHFEVAFAFYAAHDQEGSAIAQLTAGLLEMSRQIERIEIALISVKGA